MKLLFNGYNTPNVYNYFIYVSEYKKCNPTKNIYKIDFFKKTINRIKYISEYDIFKICNPYVYKKNEKKFLLINALSTNDSFARYNYRIILGEEIEKDVFHLKKNIVFGGNSPSILSNNRILYGKFLSRTGTEEFYIANIDDEFNLYGKVNKLTFLLKGEPINVFGVSSMIDDKYLIGSYVPDEYIDRNNIYNNFIFKKIDNFVYEAIEETGLVNFYKPKYIERYNTVVVAKKYSYCESGIYYDDKDNLFNPIRS